MKIEIVERNYKAREKLKDLLEKKLNRFEKYLEPSATAKVVLSAKNGRFKTEITVASGSMFVRSEVETDNMYVNVDLCLAKLERQIVKYTHKHLSRRREVDPELLLFFDEIPDFTDPKITKRKTFDLSPMTEEEAIEKAELLGNDFYVFYNKKTNSTCVIYKRHNTQNEYGIIETSIQD